MVKGSKKESKEGSLVDSVREVTKRSEVTSLRELRNDLLKPKREDIKRIQSMKRPELELVMKGKVDLSAFDVPSTKPKVPKPKASKPKVKEVEVKEEESSEEEEEASRPSTPHKKSKSKLKFDGKSLFAQLQNQ